MGAATMSFPIWGIAGTENVDRVGEKLIVSGADISELRIINDEHKTNNCFSILGQITMAKKLLQERDCTDEFELKAWRMVNKPLIFVRGNLVEGGHPNAAAAQALVKYGAQNPDFPIGFSVEGATLDRQGQLLKKTKVVAVSLTIKPCNPECRVFPAISLTKSWDPIALPTEYAGLEGRKSFRNVPTEEMRLLSKSLFLQDVAALLKSGETEGATHMKCWNCGESKLFMKMRLPNKCTACGEAFSMLDLYRATQRDSLV
jgi:DNA-directed RNA polymerase subunit RPC12/RpoP